MFGKRTMVRYKDHDIIFDAEYNHWVIRSAGTYGVSVGTSPSLKEAKRCVDGLVKK